MLAPHLAWAAAASWQRVDVTLESVSGPSRDWPSSCRFLSSKTHGWWSSALSKTDFIFASHAAAVSAQRLTQSTCTHQPPLHLCSYNNTRQKAYVFCGVLFWTKTLTIKYGHNRSQHCDMCSLDVILLATNLLNGMNKMHNFIQYLSILMLVRASRLLA